MQPLNKATRQQPNHITNQPDDHTTTQAANQKTNQQPNKQCWSNIDVPTLVGLCLVNYRLSALLGKPKYYVIFNNKYQSLS